MKKKHTGPTPKKHAGAADESLEIAAFDVVQRHFFSRRRITPFSSGFIVIGVAFVLICCSFSTGCSKGPVCYFVKGNLVFKGEALPNATVSFIPVDPDQGTLFATGRTDESGEFSLTASQGGTVSKGTTVGEYHVVVTCYQEKPARFEKSDYGPVPVYASQIPERYGNQLTSKLTASVEKKKVNEFTFTIEDK